MQVALERSLAHGVISNTLPVALEPQTVDAQGKQGFSGVEQRLVVQGNLRDVMRRPPPEPLDLAPLFRGAPKVSGLPGLPEIPVFNFLKVLRAMSLPERHYAALEGVPHRTEPPSML